MLQIVRMANTGRAHQAIAADQACPAKSVTHWLNAFRDGKPVGVRPTLK